MFIPQVYAVALFMMVLSMVCWGSWANTQKLCKNWRFELFYWDYVWGILILSALAGLTLGRTDPASPDSFFRNLGAADLTHLAYPLIGGIVFNVGNIMLVAGIEIARHGVAFAVGRGVVQENGAEHNFVVTPKGMPLLQYG